jgi:hypothetical protein
VATALIAPIEDPQILTPAGLRRLLVCFSSSDDWRALVALAGRLALPGSAAVHVCYKDLTNLYAIGGTRGNGQEYRVPFDSLPSSLHAAKALRALGLSVEFTDHAALWQEDRRKQSPFLEADLIVMTTTFSGSIAFGSQNLASRAVRLLRRPILFVRADQLPAAAPEKHTEAAVAAVSLSERSAQVVQGAAKYASTFGTALMVAHAVDSLHDCSRPDNLMSLMCACEMLARSVGRPGLQTFPRLTSGNVADVLTKSKFIENAPFVALGVDLNDPQSEADKSDTVRETIVRNAPCPVLLIPTAA